ncbi:MAG: hypothetical protein ACI4E0_06415 [Blautia sp.]
MKKGFLISAFVLVAAAIGFIAYALGHPELSFPWDNQITNILYGIYADVVVLLFVLAFGTEFTRLNILTMIFELGAVFFLIQAMLNSFSDYRSKWYLPLAMLLNCIAMFLNAVQQKKKKNARNEKNEGSQQ